MEWWRNTSDNNDNWSSECSSTINSTCPVVCNQKYGGGGDYVCHYNNHGRTVCDTINNNVYKNEKEKKDHCERFVTCTYEKRSGGTKGKCIINKNKTDHKGQLEWMGPECYLLNNEAFSHGIYNLPNLDEVYPPLIRLLTLSVIVIILLFILWKVGLLKFISNHVMGSIKDLFFKMIKGIEIMAVDLVISLTHVIKSIPDLPEIIKKDKTIVRNIKIITLSLAIVSMTRIRLELKPVDPTAPTIIPAVAIAIPTPTMFKAPFWKPVPVSLNQLTKPILKSLYFHNL